jgi:hypothetical protein
MSTPTFFMGLPNPTPFGDAGTWASEIVACNVGFDTLAVANVPATATTTGSLAVYNGQALIEADATSGSFVLTLPDATIPANKGRRYSIVKVDSTANTVTVQGFGGQQISGNASVILSTQWSILSIISDGAKWVGGDPDILTPVPVSSGGTGVATLTLNGVLYGNGTSPVLVTAQGGANSVLTANSGAPVFSSTPTVTSITTTGGTTTLAGTVTISGTASYTTANPTFFSSTGSGAVVLATSPTISGATLSGALSITGTATYTTANPTFFSATGSGAVVLATAPTLSALAVTNTITSYNGSSTAGNGVAAILAATSQKSETAADASVLSFTPPATAGSYRVRFVMSVSAANAATLGWTITYTDSNGNAQTPTNLALNQTGSAPAALTFTTSAAGNYYGAVDIDVNNSATPIVVKLTFSGTSFAAKVSSTIARII